MDEALKELSKIKTLKNVELYACQAFRDEGLIEFIKQVPTLESLNLAVTSNTAIYRIY